MLRRDFCYAKLHAATDCPTKDPTGLGRVVMEGNYYLTLGSGIGCRSHFLLRTALARPERFRRECPIARSDVDRQNQMMMS